ncbi:MAG TPA: von Willebrand factor type A domain-containing protein [Thermoanaerobaculia bacterium]|nr:von Willebrand factor type A domain-containing protein [Thermoanaerobaculia bacterium]
MKRLALVLALFVCIVSGCKSPATSIVVFPGGSGGTVDGTVTMDGKPLPGVTVMLNANRAVVSDANGKFHFVNVAPGTYLLRAEMTAMQTISQQVKVNAVNGLRVELPMKLASVSEAITVTSAAPAIFANGVGFSASPPPPPIPPPPARRGVEGGVVGGVVGGVYGGVAGGIISGAPAYDNIVLPLEQRYNKIDEHAYIDTKTEAVTTFAIDVDQASYANVRRILATNQMPPADAVRIEEMINYFTYHLPQPTDGTPFSITTEVAGCPWDTNHRLLRIGIQGRNLDQWKMAPNNLVFLLDVSGSMGPPERLPLIKSAFRKLVDQLRAEDKVSIVVYAGAAGMVLPPTSGADKATITAALDHLQSGGSTAGGQGLELAYKTARDNFLTSGNNRVILATDGDFNVGISSLDDIQKLIEEQRKSGVFLTTIGVGTDNFRDSVLETLADKGNGSYYYLDNIAEARKVFERQLTGTLVTIAKDVKVQLEFDPALVESYRQIGYENRALANQDFDDDTKDAGELGAGHSVTALYEIVPKAVGGRIATLKLRYKQPNADTSALLSVAANDEGKSAYDASPDMQFATAVAEFAMLLRKSPHRGSATYADALHLARLAQGEDLDGLREEFIRLADSARVMSGESAPVIAGQ